MLIKASGSEELDNGSVTYSLLLSGVITRLMGNKSYNTITLIKVVIWSGLSPPYGLATLYFWACNFCIDNCCILIICFSSSLQLKYSVDTRRYSLDIIFIFQSKLLCSLISVV